MHERCVPWRKVGKGEHTRNEENPMNVGGKKYRLSCRLKEREGKKALGVKEKDFFLQGGGRGGWRQGRGDDGTCMLVGGRGCFCAEKKGGESPGKRERNSPHQRVVRKKGRYKGEDWVPVQKREIGN